MTQFNGQPRNNLVAATLALTPGGSVFVAECRICGWAGQVDPVKSTIVRVEHFCIEGTTTKDLIYRGQSLADHADSEFVKPRSKR